MTRDQYYTYVTLGLNVAILAVFLGLMLLILRDAWRRRVDRKKRIKLPELRIFERRDGSFLRFTDTKRPEVHDTLGDAVNAYVLDRLRSAASAETTLIERTPTRPQNVRWNDMRWINNRDAGV